MNSTLRYAALPLLGASAIAAFAPLGWWPLWPLALALALRLSVELPPLRAALAGWLFGLGHFITGLYWTVISTHVYGGAPAWLGVMLCGVLSAFLALYPALVFGGLQRLVGLRSHWMLLALPAAWVFAELVRGWFFSGFPWFSAGYALTDTALARLAAVTGVFGLSAALCLWAAILLLLFVRGRPPALPVALTSLPVLAALLPVPSAWTTAVDQPLRAVLVQGSVEQHLKWRPEMRHPTLDRYWQMSEAALPADLLVWPEVAITYSYDQVRDSYLRALDERLKGEGASALVGITVREHGLPYNSVIAVGAVQGRYDKRHLVPFGEYFPIPDGLRPIMDVLGTPYSDLGFGAAEQTPIRVQDQRLSISICFEDVFGDEVARDAREASVLVNMTNDAWFADSTAPHQHLQIARMRAIETGRPLLRTANTGISAVISADGEIESRTAQFEPALLPAVITPRIGQTPYMRVFNQPLWWACTLILLGLVIRAWRLGENPDV